MPTNQIRRDILGWRSSALGLDPEGPIVYGRGDSQGRIIVSLSLTVNSYRGQSLLAVPRRW